MKLNIEFLGQKKVQASFDGFKVLTDQPLDNEGEGLAPAPFDLFLASLGTCAGYFIKAFCDERKISTEGLKLEEEAIWDEETHQLKEILFKIELPHDFPEKYKKSLVAVVNSCSVKKVLAHPPEFKVLTC